MNDTPRVEAAIGDGPHLLNPRTDFERLASTYSDVLRLARELERELADATSWTDEDKPLPEDEAIHAEHPLRTRDYDTYSEALRLVGAKRSKHALVDLVNWLLRQRWPK